MLDRRRQPELMDQPEVDAEQLYRSLHDLEVVGQWLGGRRTAVRLMLDLASRVPARPVRILDVGTGGADVPRALVEAARAKAIDSRIVATDLHPATLDFARRNSGGYPEIEIQRADALDLPYPDRAFHLAMCNTTLHHFEPAGAVRVLREMSRVAEFGIVVTDLARSRSALIGAHLLAMTLWRSHPITRHDGPASVRAAYTPAELRALAASVFGEPPRVRRRPVFRLSLVVDRTGA